MAVSCISASPLPRLLLQHAPAMLVDVVDVSEVVMVDVSVVLDVVMLDLGGTTCLTLPV